MAPSTCTGTYSLASPRVYPRCTALGVLMNRRADHDQAVFLLKQAVAIHPGDPALHVELGEAYRNLQVYQDAIGCCLIGLRLHPVYPKGWNTLGLASLEAAIWTEPSRSFSRRSLAARVFMRAMRTRGWSSRSLAGWKTRPSTSCEQRNCHSVSQRTAQDPLLPRLGTGAGRHPPQVRGSGVSRPLRRRCRTRRRRFAAPARAHRGGAGLGT